MWVMSPDLDERNKPGGKDLDLKLSMRLALGIKYPYWYLSENKSTILTMIFWEILNIQA